MFKILLEAVSHAEFYKDGFFGYGEKGDFTYFSFWHFLPIILLIGGIILTYFLKDKIKNWKYEATFRFFLGFLMLVVEMSYYWRVLYTGPDASGEINLLTRLPLQVCEWTCIFAAVMIFTLDKHLFDIDVFVCLTIGIVPLITPAVIVYTGPTYYRYYQFFLEHELPIYAVFYMIFVHGYKFDIKKVYKPVIFLAVLVVFAIIFNNLIPKANYLYLNTTTDGGSIANVLPPNIYIRLLIFTLLICLMFTIEGLVFFLIRKLRAKKEAKQQIEEGIQNA